MTALNRKLLRDLWQTKGQALAIGLVVACGAATFIMSLSTLEALQRSMAEYYRRYRFADVFASLKRAPNSLADRIVEIPGVAQVQTRIVVDVNLDVPGLAEPAVGRLISLPEGRLSPESRVQSPENRESRVESPEPELFGRDAARSGSGLSTLDSGLSRPVLNGVHLRRGRWIEPGRAGEVLVNEVFAEAHGLQPGDSLQAVINGRYQKLSIVGVALSPEYVLQIPRGDAVPDNKRFGVFWMGYEELAHAFDMYGGFNHVSLSLMRGASEREVIARLDRMLRPYGGVGAYGRDEQVSHRYLRDEIRGLRGMGLVAPVIFIGVAAFLLNVVLSRLVATQREQIAALKAFGYTKFETGMHYVKLVLIIAAVGSALGTIVGFRLGLGMTRMYMEFYRFPVIDFRLDAWIAAAALLLCGGAALAGTLGAVRRAVRLPPAEAMRPEPPARYRPTIIERWGLQRLFSQAARMILRHLERRPLKAFLSSLGIALAVAILVLGNFMVDALNYLIEFQYYTAQRHDVSVSFTEPVSARAAHEIDRLPGVLGSETFRSVPARLRAGHRERRVGIMGLPPERRLFRLLDADERQVTLPEAGLVLSDKLAELLAVRQGESVIVEVLEGERPLRRVKVNGIITEYSGTSAYMDVRALHRLLQEGGSISGAFLSVDESRLEELYRRLRTTPRVAGISVKRAALESFRQTVAENQLRMQSFLVAFAAIIAFGVVYNTARIALSERSRELATLRVIGFTRAEISMIFLGELAVLTLAAMPLGMGLGYVFAAATARAFESELYRIPVVIEPATYAAAAVVVLASAAVSGLVVRRRLDRLDLVAVLKSKE